MRLLYYVSGFKNEIRFRTKYYYLSLLKFILKKNFFLRLQADTPQIFSNYILFRDKLGSNKCFLKF